MNYGEFGVWAASYAAHYDSDRDVLRAVMTYTSASKEQNMNDDKSSKPFEELSFIVGMPEEFKQFFEPASGYYLRPANWYNNLELKLDAYLIKPGKEKEFLKMFKEYGQKIIAKLGENK